MSMLVYTCQFVEFLAQVRIHVQHILHMYSYTHKDVYNNYWLCSQAVCVGACVAAVYMYNCVQVIYCNDWLHVK